MLEIGDVLPDITLKNEKEENVNVQDLAKDHGVVIFLVPKADTREFVFYDAILKGQVHIMNDGSVFLFWLESLVHFPASRSFQSPSYCNVLLLAPLCSEHVTNCVLNSWLHYTSLRVSRHLPRL